MKLPKVNDIIEYPDDRKFWKDYRGSRWKVLSINSVGYMRCLLVYKKYPDANDSQLNMVPNKYLFDYSYFSELKILKRTRLPSWF